jgi:predicted transcriptional regulator YdeE
VKKEIVKISEKKLIGTTIQTNNKTEMNPETAKIGSLVQTYWNEGIFNKITNRKNPGTTYCAYTNYESDVNGDYTFFIGEEVEDFFDAEAGLTSLIIPKQSYVRFTSGPGSMPDVCIHAWQKIWQMTDDDFGGNRSYKVDFEVYDERSKDPTFVVLDIYLGIEK